MTIAIQTMAPLLSASNPWLWLTQTLSGLSHSPIAGPTVWQSAIEDAAPLMLAAVAGTISERSGILNIGLEGMMLLGAFFSVVTADKIAGLVHGPLWIASAGSIVGAMLAGGLAAAALGLVAIRFRANQVITGLAVNLIALGITGYLFTTLYTGNIPPSLAGIPNANIPVLGNISFLHLGTSLFQQNILVYLAFFVVAIAQTFLFQTRTGLRIRACGEHPLAADTAGINVMRLRYLCVILSGALCGLAGASLTMVGIHGTYAGNPVSGRGYIALAAVILGRWTPIGAMLACLVFGFGEALQFNMSGVAVHSFQIPTQWWSMLPYILTLIAVGVFMRHSHAPAADGLPFDPESPS